MAKRGPKPYPKKPPIVMESMQRCRRCDQEIAVSFKVPQELQHRTAISLMGEHMRERGWLFRPRNLLPCCPACVKRKFHRKPSRVNTDEAMFLRTSDPKTWTLEKLGEKYGVTRQMVEKQLKKAERMRHKIAGGFLGDA